jgi:hypothetical protein
MSNQTKNSDEELRQSISSLLDRAAWGYVRDENFVPYYKEQSLEELMQVIKSEIRQVLDRLVALPNIYPEKINGEYTHVQAVYKSAIEAERKRYE